MSEKNSYRTWQSYAKHIQKCAACFELHKQILECWKKGELKT